MAGLQRSAVSFRRQGSSGLVWDDKLISGELNQVNNDPTKPMVPDGSPESSGNPEKLPSRTGRSPPPPIQTASATLERNRSTGGTRYRTTGRVSPAIEPPSPKVSACGFCAAFGKHTPEHAKKPPKRGNKRRSR